MSGACENSRISWIVSKMSALAELVSGRGVIRANDGHGANWLVLAPARSSTPDISANPPARDCEA
jgi:hypothetical protein